MIRRALGKGLNALIAEGQEGEAAIRAEIENLPIDSIKRSRFELRKQFDDEKLSELTESIRQKGLIQPVIVRKGTDGYELIAGQRRLRAARNAGETHIPAIQLQVSDEEVLEMGLIENLQRDDLNPVEYAQAFKLLMEQFGLTQEQIAEKVSKDRSSVANYLRILSLPESVIALLRDEKLSLGHAKALLSIDDAHSQEMLASIVASEGLSVRECEQLAAEKSLPARKLAKTKRVKKPGVTKDHHVLSIEEKFQQILGTKVLITPKKTGGKIEIEYYSDDDLERILNYFEMEDLD
ncbi:MAG: ParB/RepB/Spo0J family partition protein [Thermoplasmata archaeon]|nr:ParB/RepB/Spo0J family partition protein [Thermoplasmata archaeon]